MKRFLSLLLVIFCFSVSAQEKIKPIIYSEVVPVENVSAEELFTRGRIWFAKAYNNSKVVLQMAANNVLVGKALYRLSVSPGGLSTADISISYVIKIQCRDGRYKYTIDEIVATPKSAGWGKFGLLTTETDIAKTGMGKKQRNEVWRRIKQAFEVYQFELVASLKLAMYNSEQDVSGDDW